jgi:hypothetical protein
MADDSWELDVSSGDLALIRAMAVAPPGSPIRPGTPTRVPGALDSIAFITAHADSLATGVIGSLIAAWIWAAHGQAKAKVKVQITFKRFGRRLDVKVEADSEEKVAAIISEAFAGADFER